MTTCKTIRPPKNASSEKLGAGAFWRAAKTLIVGLGLLASAQPAMAYLGSFESGDGYITSPTGTTNLALPGDANFYLNNDQLQGFMSVIIPGAIPVFQGDTTHGPDLSRFNAGQFGTNNGGIGGVATDILDNSGLWRALSGGRLNEDLHAPYYPSAGAPLDYTHRDYIIAYQHSAQSGSATLDLLANDDNLSYVYEFDSRDFDGTSPAATSDRVVLSEFWICPTSWDDLHTNNLFGLGFVDNAGRRVMEFGYTGDDRIQYRLGAASAWTTSTVAVGNDGWSKVVITLDLPSGLATMEVQAYNDTTGSLNAPVTIVGPTSIGFAACALDHLTWNLRGGSNLAPGAFNNKNYFDSFNFTLSVSATPESCPLAIGNLVFNDLDGDRKYEPSNSETGVPGVKVQLYTSAGVEINVGPDGVLNTMDDASGGVVTDAGGAYHFKGLAPGDYYVKIPASEFGTGKPLAGKLSSTGGGANDTADDNADENGLDDLNAVTNGIRSNTINLAANGEPVAELGFSTAQADDDSTNHTVDFGFVSPGPCQILPNDVLQPGYALFSCKSQYGSGSPVLAVVNTRATAALWANPSNRGNNQGASYPEPSMWMRNQFGDNEILGVAFDTRDNTMYVSTTALFTGIGVPTSPSVYRISRDGSTVELFATLPGNRGTGWLDIDEEHDQLYVTNMDDGAIYVVPLAGGVGQTGPFATFAPFTPDALNESDTPTLANYFNWSPSGQRIFSVAYHPLENRLYYSMWNTDSGTRTGNPNTIRSVAITASGIIDAPTDRLEITLPNQPQNGAAYSSPVTDIAFDRSGTRMLLAEQTLLTSDFGIYSSAHQSRLLQANGISGAWAMDSLSKFGIGGDAFAANPYNSRGGTSWGIGSYAAGYTYGNEQWVVTTGDALNFRGDGTPSDPYVYTYGLHIAPSGGSVNSGVAILVDLDNETTNQDKSIYGDIDVRMCPPEPTGLGNLVFIDNNRDGKYDAGIDTPKDGVQVDLYDGAAMIGVDLPICSQFTSGGGGYRFYPLDPGNYKIHIPATEFQPGGPLFGYASSENNGEDTQTDDTGDENGIDSIIPSADGIVSPVINLVANGEPVGGVEGGYLGTTDVPDEDVDYTWDFGFVSTDLGIGNLVYVDTNGNRSYEVGVDTPLPNVTVKLFTVGQNPLTGTPAATDVTDGSGRYLFGNLGAGDYFVFIPPEEFGAGGDLHGYVSAPSTSAGDDNLGEDGIDAPVAVLTGVSSAQINLRIGDAPTSTSGESGFDASSDDSKDADYDLTVDFGFIAVPDLCLLQVTTASSDDGYELSPSGEIDSGGINRLTRTFGVLGYGVTAGARFTGVTVPRGATITSAYIVFAGNEEGDGGGTGTMGDVSVKITAQAADSPATYTTAPFDFSSRPDTAASVDWTITAPWTAGLSDTASTSPDIASVLQEVVSRPGWVSGSPIGITVENISGTESRRWETFDGNPALAPKLVVCYTPPKVGIGNLVFVDANRNGVADAGEGKDGVTLILKDGLGNDVDSDSGTPGVQPTTTVTAGGGRYLFDNLPVGSYIVSIPATEFQSGGDLAGILSLAGFGTDNGVDDANDENGVDVTAPWVSGISSGVIDLDALEPSASETGIGGDSDDGARELLTDLTVDFGFEGGKPTAFAGWQQQNGLGGLNNPTDDPDGDGFTNLEEFAFCLHPDSGAGVACPLDLVPQAGNTVNALMRRLQVSTGITYTLQSLSDLSASPGGWTDVTGIVPTLTTNGDGTQTATYVGVDSLFAGDQGFFRVKVTDTGSGATVYTDVEGFTRRTFQVGCVTCSVPYSQCARSSGVVDSISGASLVCATSAGSSSILDSLVPGKQHYIEITSGDHKGHRLEANEAATTATSLAIDLASPLSTMATLPSTFAGDSWVLRQHQTLSGLFPPAKFSGATNSPASADRVLMHEGMAFKIYWLYLNGGSPYWVDVGDTGVADAGNVVINPCAGFFVHPKGAPVTIVFDGAVRANDFVCPLPVGSTLIGGGWPLDQSPNDRAMTAASGFNGSRKPTQADKAMLWKGDVNPTLTGYDLNSFLTLGTVSRWASEADATLVSLDNADFFKSLRAAFIKVQTAKPTYTMPLPWTP